MKYGVPLTAPFIWRGGKRRVAAEIWRRFGPVRVYCEPFAGSLAVLLGCPHPADREIVGDLDGLVCNFWRAVRDDPATVARYIEGPNVQWDLTARHKWLVAWRDTERRRLRDDPDFYDARAAGWWAWGVSHYIGGGFCTGPVHDVIPYPGSPDGRGGYAIQYQTVRPFDAPRWLDALSDRLRRVVVFNSDWRKCVTPTLLCDRRDGRGRPKAVLLDPPYLTANRSTGMYAVDGNANEVAAEAYEWAVANGRRYRIAYCCAVGDFPVPAGWDATQRTFVGGTAKYHAARPKDQVMYSPACLRGGLGLV